jgi:hypothetical protein
MISLPGGICRIAEMVRTPQQTRANRGLLAKAVFRVTVKPGETATVSLQGSSKDKWPQR